MISTVTQMFYAWRIARLTGRLWVGGLIVASALAQFGKFLNISHRYLRGLKILTCITGAGIGGSVGFSIVTDFNLFPKFKTVCELYCSKREECDN